MPVHSAVTQALRSAATDTGPTVNSNGVVEWGVKNIIPLILLVIGIGIIASARKGRISDNANTVTNVVLGMVVISGAALLYTFAGQLSDLVFGSG
jgi:predicted MFS family arabinose efflux permease